jgi:valyl-tRNA synthetase
MKQWTVDWEKEKQFALEDIAKAKKMIERSERKLSSTEFLDKAPKEVVTQAFEDLKYNQHFLEISEWNLAWAEDHLK